MTLSSDNRRAHAKARARELGRGGIAPSEIARQLGIPLFVAKATLINAGIAWTEKADAPVHVTTAPEPGSSTSALVARRRGRPRKEPATLDDPEVDLVVRHFSEYQSQRAVSVGLNISPVKVRAALRLLSQERIQAWNELIALRREVMRPDGRSAKKNVAGT